MRDWRYRYGFNLVVAALLVLGCAGCSHEPAASNTAAQVILETNPDTHTVALFKIDAKGDAPPLATIKEDSSDLPVDVSADLTGQIFVANANGNVKVYVAHNHRFQHVRTITGPHTELFHPTGIASDIGGDFYICETGGPGNARVEWFAAGLNGNILPDWKLMGPQTGITDPRGIALDGSGRVYIADAAKNAILVFDSNPKGDIAPFATLTQGLHTPQRVTVDMDLDVYVTNADGSVVMYVPTGPQSWDFGARFTSPALRKPQGIAVDAAGRVAVASSGTDSILFFAPNAKGVVTPVQDLRGPTRMNPVGLKILH
ncbi:MAG: NHL repeat-containing protein [Candidatus Binataceae bacterium]